MLFITVGLAGCASNGAIVDPLIWWEEDDPADYQKYGPTPIQRIETLEDLAAGASRMSPAEREAKATDLAKNLVNEPNILIRVEMVRCLGAMQTESSMAGLKSAIFDPEAEVRHAAVVALGNTKNPEAVPVLADALIRDRNYDVRLACATSLGEFKSAEANRALIPALDQRDPAMRFAAVQSLKNSSDIDYRGDTDKWREFANGGSPIAPETSIAEQLIPSFIR